MRPHTLSPAPPANTRELLAVLRAARLLSAAQVRRLRAGWSEEDEPAARARQLVAAGLLTAYQAERVLGGRARRLVLGQYRILDWLGAGGMGRVYKAEHVWMKRVVALKVVRGRQLAAFRREVEAAKRVQHPNLVAAHDAAEARGRLFLVMEYVDGIDLHRLLDETGSLPVALAVEVGRQTARALQHLHEHGLVHRDVKPANLLLTWPGRGNAWDSADSLGFPEGPPAVKLLDLGLVRRSAGAEDDLHGTPDYMAPERGMGGGPDIRSDLYSLGCTLYQLLSGQVPFPGGSWTAKLVRHRLESPVPLLQLRPEVPAALAAIVERLMARAADERFPTSASVEAALAALAGNAGGPASAPEAAPPPAPTAGAGGGRLPGPWACFTAVGLGLLLGGAVQVLPAARKPAEPALQVRPGAFVAIGGRPERFATLAEAVAAAPDGATLTLHGAGPFRTPPLAWRGKSLTLRAGAGTRPRVEHATGGDQPWGALLSSDRPLHLVGIDLRSDDAGAAPLVRVDGATFQLVDCRLSARAGSGPLVALRGGGGLEVRGGRLEAGVLAVSAEVGPGCRLRLADCTVRARDGVAVSLWAGEGAAAGPAEVVLERSAWEARRILACRALPGPVAVRAAGNTFTFRDGLLSCAGYVPSDGWRQLLSWRGGDNRHHASGPWVRIDGEPLAVRDPRAWERLWATPETRP